MDETVGLAGAEEACGFMIDVKNGIGILNQRVWEKAFVYMDHKSDLLNTN